jgi:putative transcriptional regulator
MTSRKVERLGDAPGGASKPRSNFGLNRSGIAMPVTTQVLLLCCALLVGTGRASAPEGGAAVEPPAARREAILLVADPTLVDPNFRETVVLVTRYRGFAGPLGVVISRPTPVPVSRALPQIPALAALDDKVYFGGPVARQALFYVFRADKAPEDAIEVADGVYLDWGAARLKELLSRDKPMEGLRIYAGHASWAPGQLEAEVARGSWRSARPEDRIIFSAKPESMWGELDRRARATPARYDAVDPTKPPAGALSAGF